MNRRMQKSLAGFVAALLAVWGIVGTAGYFYSRQQDIPPALALAVLPAALLESGFWVAMASDEVRRRFTEWRTPAARALALTACGLLPYFTYSIPTGTFRWESFALLGALVLAVSLWYAVLPRRRLADLLFLAFVAAVILGRGLPAIYAAGKLRVDVLGDLMWRRTAMLSVLTVRQAEGIGFGFFPSAKDWRIGGREFLFFLPIGAALTLALGYMRFHVPDGPAWKIGATAIGTFLGMLWVVALSEEFFFRGLLQQWLSNWLANPLAGLLIASVVFGAAHLPFRAFPNWRFALIAAIAGFFYGRAYARAGSIRAAMVAHALTNTTWRMLFQ